MKNLKNLKGIKLLNREHKKNILGGIVKDKNFDCKEISYYLGDTSCPEGYSWNCHKNQCVNDMGG
ncbi:hypothetical protein [Chryseobacterium gregarium]|uniref:hypothetical protein n=1 Tax=Chryseobacterium gregarium TaxID=456299 RepID=UPI0004173110|nr:hypothetical protein [Chryseobacterium gregarium]